MTVVLVGSNLLADDPPASRVPSAGVRSEPGGSAAQVPDAAPFVRAALQFVAAWSRLPAGSTPEQWQSSLVPITTTDLAQALKSTDPEELPDSAPDGEPVVRYLAQSSALVAVPLANGSSVLVTVVTDGSGPKVSDVQPFSGDN
jgi:hypothetical protein